MKTRPTRVAADADNRSRLLHAASDVFAEFGFEGASLRAIADAAGVSFQLIAYYFGSKEELWVATVDYLFERYLETGKGLGFTPSGNLHEQFHNHLRLLLTDMLQRPQLHKICVQEYLADSARFRNVIAPKLEHMFTNARSAVLSRRRAARASSSDSLQKRSACCSRRICKANLGHPRISSSTRWALPAGSAKAVEQQVDLIFAILTERLPTQLADADESTERPPRTRRRALARSRDGNHCDVAVGEARGRASRPSRAARDRESTSSSSSSVTCRWRRSCCSSGSRRSSRPRKNEGER